MSDPRPFQPAPPDPLTDAVTQPPAEPALDPDALTLPPTAPFAAPPPPGPTVAVPGYEILGELGRGGMGVVYRARHTQLNRVVALKMILSGGLAGTAELTRFRAEAESVARLQHPGIVQIYEVGEHEGRPYFSLEFVDGGSLEKRLDGTPLPPKAAAALVVPLAQAMHYAHERGVVHRDLKPANILLGIADCRLQIADLPSAASSPGKSAICNLQSAICKITDFGLAKQLDSQHGQTQSGAIMGTPSYMAPEQAGGRTREIGPATDVYALGAVLYECLTGRPPFRAGTPLDTILQVATADPVPPRLLQPQLPRDLETVCLKCLEKDPRRRYASAADLADDLRRFLADESVRARQPGPVERAGRWLRKQRRGVVITLASAVMSVLLIGLLLFGLTRWMERQEGSLELTTEGHALIAEIFDDGDLKASPIRRTVPTAEPVRLWPGSYRVRLSKNGDLSETYRLFMERGQKLRFDVQLTERHLWEPYARGGAASIHAVPFGPTTTDLVFLENEQDVRRHDPRTQKEVWSFQLNGALLPPGGDAGEWRVLLQNVNGETPGLLSPPHDLDGDGVADLVVSSRNTSSLLALSGATGRPLWWHRSLRDVGGRPAANTYRGRVVEQPVVLPGKGPPDLLVAYFASGEAGADGDRGGSARWVERISGRDGKLVWRHEVDKNSFSRDGDATSAPFLGPASPGAEVWLAAGRFLVSLDVATGRPSGAAVALGATILAVQHRGDLDGDSADDLLLVQESPAGLALAAFSPARRAVTWAAAWPEGSAHFRVSGQAIPQNSGDRPLNPLMARLDPNGPSDVLLPVAGRSADGSRWFGVVAERPGAEPRWRAKLLKEMPSGTESLARLVEAPDLDGDGWRDVVVAFVNRRAEIGPGKSGSALTVYALSGQDGRTLWFRTQVVDGESPTVGALVWWQPGQHSLPQLIVPVTAKNEPVACYVFDIGTGEVAHILPGVGSVDVADLDGDGLPDLTYNHINTFRVLLEQESIAGLSGMVSVRTVGKLHGVRGRPPEAWRHLGSWHPGHDLDGDGWPDLVRHLDGRVAAVSGADGRVLWPHWWLSSVPPREAVAPAVRPGETITAAGVLRLPPLPHGDLDGDGWPDVLAHRTTQGWQPNTPQSARLPLSAVSGRDGSLLWQEPAFDLIKEDVDPGSLSVFPGWSTCVPRPGTSPLVVVTCTLRSFRGWLQFRLLGLDGASGRVLWNQLVTEMGHFRNGDFLACRPEVVVADLGHGRTDVVLCAPARRDGQPMLGVDVVAYRSADGECLWRQPLAFRRERFDVGEGRLPTPVVGKLTPDGPPTVVVLDQEQALALDGRDGSRLWAHGFAPAFRLEDRGHLVPQLAQSADGSHLLLFTTRGEPNELWLLTPSGAERTRHRLLPNRGAPNQRGVFVGDGADDVLFTEGGRIVRWRGADPKRLAWTWPSAEEAGRFGPVHVREALDPSSPKVVAMASERGAVYVLDGKTGQPQWRGRNEVAMVPRLAVLPAPDDATAPRVVNSRDEQSVAVHEALPVGPDGSCRPVPRPHGAYVSPTDDPRLRRPFPFAPRQLAPAARGTQWIFGATFSLLLLVLPWIVARWWWRERTRRRGLVALTGLASLAGLAALLDTVWDPQGAPKVLAIVACLPFVVVLGTLTTRMVRREWRGAARLVGGWLLLAALLGAGALAYDARFLEAGESYSWHGWRYYWLPGLHLTGDLMMLFGLARGLLRAVRWVFRRRKDDTATPEDHPRG